MASNNQPQGNDPSSTTSPSTTPSRKRHHPDSTQQNDTTQDIFKQESTQESHDDTDLPSTNEASIQNGSSRLNLNPTLLLNPKGYAAQAAQSPLPRQNVPNRSFSGSTEPPSDVEFQFSNPQDGFASTSQYTYTNGQALPQTHDFSGMIDRMNNVEQRTFAPQSKRRRLESEESTNSMHGFGSGGGSDMGQYIKENRQNTADYQPPPNRVETVDLTDASE